MEEGTERTAAALVRLLPIAVLSGDGTVRSAFGHECGGIAGHDPDALRGQLLFEYVHPHDLVTAVDHFVDLRDGRRLTAEVSARLRGPDGAYRDAELSMYATADAEVIVWCRDTTAKAMAAEALDSATLRSALVEQTGVLFAVLEPNGDVRYLNPTARHALGARDDFDAPDSLLDLVHHDDIERAEKRIRAANAVPGRRVECSLRIQAIDGWRRYDVAFVNLTEDPAIGGLVAEAIDVTDRANAEAELVRRTLHDPLTGIANRVLMRDRLMHALGRLRRGAPALMVAYVDLDDFKPVNDSLGHEAGDIVLTTVAQRLAASVRPGDTVARVGGDEFVIVCPDVVHEEAAEGLARRFSAAVAEPIDLPGTLLSITASVGAVMFDEPVDSTDALRSADAAMYRAKTHGKGCVVRDAYSS